MAQDPQYNITCYRPNGTAVGVNSVRGRCPLGLTRQPPTSPVSQAVSSSDDIANYTTGGYGNYNYPDTRPEDFEPNSETDPFSVQDLLDQLLEFDTTGSQEDVVAAVNAGESNLSILICHSPCNSSGNYSLQASASGSCPASHPFLVAPDCSDARDSIDALMDLFREQQEALANAQNNNNTEETEALKKQLADLQMQIQLAQMQPTPEPKQAGLGGIPMWAILGGLGLVAVIAIMGSRRPAAVVAAK
jgi:hypothetical protein